MSARRTGAAALVAVLAVLAALLTPASPASASVQSVSTRDTTRLLDGITSTRIEAQLSGGARARGNLLRFRPGTAGLELRPVSARDTVAGLETMSSMARRELPGGAVAGINGGYWLGRPTGAPNGLHIEDTRLFAGDSVNRSGNPVGRGVVGISGPGALVMDRLGVQLELDFAEIPEQPPVEIDEINRQVRTSTDGTREVTGELLLFDDNYGTKFEVPGGSTLLVVEELPLGSSGRETGRVLNVIRPTYDTSFRVPDGTTVLLEYGDRGGVRSLDHVVEGMALGVTVTISPFTTPEAAWEDLTAAIAGGPLLIRGGERLSVLTWREEAFSESHITGRQPRTAIAQDADGRILLLTVDGRRSGWSDGATLIELSEILLELGAVDALNLDGGGSTTMTVDGDVHNWPSESSRSVANALFVYAPTPPPARGLDRACDGAPSAGFADTVGTIHESSIDCLAWWRVTAGVTATSFEPSSTVERAQMASFLAQWIDDVAARGDGRALPGDAEARFDDVSAGNVHADNISRLAGAGILGGTEPGMFDPTSPVTRAQTASLIRAATEYSSGQVIDDARDTFVDDAGNIHEGAINALAHLGVISGVGGFSYAPREDVKRGSMSALVMRASDHLVESGTVGPPA